MKTCDDLIKKIEDFAEVEYRKAKGLSPIKNNSELSPGMGEAPTSFGNLENIDPKDMESLIRAFILQKFLDKKQQEQNEIDKWRKANGFDNDI